MILRLEISGWRTCNNENNVSMCVCNPPPSTDELTTFDQSVFLSHLRHLELCDRHNGRIQNEGGWQGPPAAKHGQVCGEKVWVSAEGPGVGWISWPRSCPLFEGRLEGAIHHCPPPCPRPRHSSVSAKNGRPQHSATCDPY